jgi:RNA polymerase sigma-70 factor (ECF subfamily)
MTAFQVEDQVVASTSVSAYASDADLIAALRIGNETAFEWLIDRYQRTMLRVAAMYVANQFVAEEVVQETWLAVLQSLHLFEGRSALKTWIFRILSNRAKTRGIREARSVPFSGLEPVGTEEAAVDPAHFYPPGHADAGWWTSYPRSWDDIPEQRLLSDETRSLIETAITALPESQRMVISLRDVEGWTSDEVCQSLNISENNQRVLLHRARSRVRQALGAYFAEA